MPELIAMPILALALFLASFRFTDMWYHERGGLKWVWLSHHASLPLWLARISLGLAIILILLMPLIGMRMIVGSVVAVLFLMHMACLGTIK
jgi:hypothetical protein